MQRIVRGRITFTPHVNPVSGAVDGYDFSAPTRFDRLFTGMSTVVPAGLNPHDRTGKEKMGVTPSLDRFLGAVPSLKKVVAPAAGGRNSYEPGPGAASELPLGGMVRRAA